TSIYAPLEGTVHSFGFFDDAQNTGGTILLEHQTDAGDIFYTLYGHLSHNSVANLTQGQAIKAGDEIAQLGTPAENGAWPPHLHFQILADHLGFEAGFPGVALPSQREVWGAFCPDPNLILKIPAEELPSAADDYDETLSVRQKKLGRNLSLGYNEPLKIVRGWQQYLWDHQGHKYLDAYNNVPHVGHCHPKVVAAAQQQMTVLNTNTRYLHDFLNRYAERLTATLPDPLNVCFFVNSASEANELALRLVNAYTGQKSIIVLEGAYHGHTTSLIDISPYKHDGPGGTGAPEWVYTAPIADVYRGLYKANDPLAGQKYADNVQTVIKRIEGEGKKVGGYIAESCPSVGGQIIFPEGYLAATYEYVRAAGGLTIADEVQTGYGRTGTHFYAFEAQNVVPDIVVLGKPIGNGHPIGALITTPAIADVFNNGMEFFSTFGGNTVSCAVGLAVLDVLAEENLQAQAHQVGQRLLAGLQPFVDKYPIVGDVRGSGLFLGIELVRDQETLEPAAAEASFVSNRLREHGILVGTDGPYHNVVKIRPPMPFDEANADFLVETLDRIFEADFSG
ncbi:MAG: aminotransferase class III-fold pyridoxal phosphate-dependent enzyme, partial [Chloroflexota bacterium]